jgi:hypothetical protein
MNIPCYALRFRYYADAVFYGCTMNAARYEKLGAFWYVWDTLSHG